MCLSVKICEQKRKRSDTGGLPERFGGLNLVSRQLLKKKNIRREREHKEDSLRDKNRRGLGTAVIPPGLYRSVALPGLARYSLPLIIIIS